MFRRLLSLVLMVLIIIIPIKVAGQEVEELSGKVTALSASEPAPYSGILLDNIAASKMIVDKKYLRAEIELELRKEFQKQLIEKTLEFDLLKVEFDTLKKIHTDTLNLREQEIVELNKLLKDEMNDHSHWWFVGGAVLGVILSVTIFYASVEIAK